MGLLVPLESKVQQELLEMDLLVRQELVVFKEKLVLLEPRVTLAQKGNKVIQGLQERQVLEVFRVTRVQLDLKETLERLD